VHCYRTLSVFITEDVRSLRLLLVATLECANYRVAYAAENRRAADAYLASAAPGDFNVAVLDGSLSTAAVSEQDGPELAAYIRAHHPGVPIIGFSFGDSAGWAEFPIKNAEGASAVLQTIQDHYLSRGFSCEI
jgi:CheY-like chemotaxis protein